MIEQCNYTVYMHENKISGKKYVGCTMKNPEHRWANGRGYNHNKVFNDEIQKYGWDNFNHIILETGLCREDAMKKEEFYIQKYNTTNPSFGYNRCNKSQVLTVESRQKISNKGKGKIISKETRQKLSAANKGHKVSIEIRQQISTTTKASLAKAEIRQKMSDSHKGENHPMYGKHHSNETKAKISATLTGTRMPDETKSKISATLTGTSRSTITKQKISDSHKGLKLSNEAKLKLSNISKGTTWINNGSINKKVKLDQLGEYLANGFVKGRIKKLR